MAISHITIQQRQEPAQVSSTMIFSFLTSQFPRETDVAIMDILVVLTRQFTLHVALNVFVAFVLL